MTDVVNFTEDTAGCGPSSVSYFFSFGYFNRPPLILAKADLDLSLFDISKFKIPDFSKNYFNFIYDNNI